MHIILAVTPIPAIEKILMKNSGLKLMGGTKVWDNTRCAFVFDQLRPVPRHQERGESQGNA